MGTRSVDARWRRRPGAGVLRITLAAATCLWTSAVAAGQQPVDAGARIFGRVVGGDGAAVGGATVRLLRSRLETLPGMLEQNVNDHTFVVATTETDEHGKFQLAVDRGGLFGVSAAVGTGRASVVQFPVHPSETVEIELFSSRALRGKVVERDADGTSRRAAGARVDVIVPDDRMYADLPGEITVRPMRVTDSVRTGADGSFSVVVPTSRPALLDVAAATRRETQMLDPGAEGELEVVLTEPPRLFGVVREAGSEKPLAGALVSWGYANSESPTATSDAAGRFELPGEYGGFLQVVPRDHQRAYVSIDLASSSADAPTVIEVEPGRRVSARFLRADGSPLDGARMFLLASLRVGRTTYGGIAWSQRLAADGSLHLGCLQDGIAVSGFLEVDGAFARVLRVMPGEQPIDLGELRVRVDAEVRGAVRDAGGTPVPGASVLIVPRMPAGTPPDLAFAPRDTRYVRTDHAGRFRIDRLAPGDYALAAVAREGAPGFAEVRAGTTPTSVTLALRKGEPVAGVLRDADGAPVADAHVRLFNRAMTDDERRFALWSYHCRTDAHGRFECHVPPDGTFSVQASGKVHGTDVHARFDVQVEAGDKDLELTLHQ